ncbi:hypothetical protein SLEP1_g16318 [Rubroshorea leprosula]|uniref:PH domain-containing protein n=1 Tax=Rubroshorea leprosula TaxID=152421 RepID=A0AAV5IW45_9ROSI|nr:hypothetical protein SLEP1_g16318 [Rubroshorea leprosula]
MANQLKYSCNSATETLEWIKAIADFIRPYSFLINAHVVNFFKDRLWEAVDKEWIECLRKEPVENLLLIPSGTVQDHWPPSLKEFILTLRSLEFPRESADLKTVFNNDCVYKYDHVFLLTDTPRSGYLFYYVYGTGRAAVSCQQWFHLSH